MTKEKGTLTRSKKMSMLKIKIKCLSSGDTSAGPPSVIRLPSQVPRPYWPALYVLVNFFHLKSWRNVILTCLMFSLLTKYKTGLETLFLWSSFSEWSGRWPSSLVLSLAHIKLFPIILFLIIIDYFIGLQWRWFSLFFWPVLYLCENKMMYLLVNS